MSVQETRRILAACSGNPAAAARATVTGGPIDAFSEGWAKLCFTGERGHYWKPAPPVRGFIPSPGVSILRSACGVLGGIDDRVPALQVGTFDYCRKCANKRGAGPSDAERGL